MRYLLFLFIPCMIFGQTIYLTDDDIRAFPGAVGHGQDATGGRGLGVFPFTNLNSTGTGSFAQAIDDAEAAGGGNIIPRVGGNIPRTGQLIITGSNISIWGQAAPGDGFAIHNWGTNFLGQNIIARHFRIRVGDDADGTGGDAIRILQVSGGPGTYANYMFDHMSLSWADDENFAVETGTSGDQTISKITLSNSILSEGFDGKNAILYGQNITQVSFIRNFFANSQERNIRSGSGGNNNQFEEINNVIYGYNAGIVVQEDTDFDAIGNVFEDSFGTPCCGEIRIVDSSNDRTNGATDYYILDNTSNGAAASKTNDANSTAGTAAGSPQFSSGYTALASSVVKDTILASAGARATLSGGLDDLDLHIRADLVSGSTGSFATAESGTTGLPTLASGTAYTDTDGDGLSDAYETANGGTVTQSTRPATAVISNGVTIDQSGVTNYATTGYTHLEIFMADLANDWDHFTPVSDGGGVRVTPSTRVGIGAGIGGIKIGL